MPRANRYILPGQHYHVTHRCHNRSFLLRFARDREEYRRRLREALGQFGVKLLTYCITSNHTHLLLDAESTAELSGLMQKLEGEFAEYYNLRKRRSGAFWGGRYHATMIASGEHLWNCMKYIELNMVRAGVVRHPREWPWCGFPELVGERKRYRLLDLRRVLDACGGGAQQDFVQSYRQSIELAIHQGTLAREPIWTESIAVGPQAFVTSIAQQTGNRVQLETAEVTEGVWSIRETGTSYG